MRNLLFQLFFFVKTLFGFGQQLPPEELCVLPVVLQENSGMLALTADSILFINDSNNPPLIYLADTTGVVLKEVYVTGFPNTDWEELAYDGGDRIFVGNFGNNLNNRQDLSIGVLSLNELLSSDTVPLIDTILFSYARQNAFPPPPAKRDYDVEAMIYHNDSLFLFSKNRRDPFDGKVYQYSLPAEGGTYNLSPVDSFSSGQGLMLSYWITAAAYQEGTETLLLLGYDKLWRFDNSKSPYFFNGKTPTVYSLNGLTPKEAIDFVEDSLIYMSDERSALGQQRLYRASLYNPTISLQETRGTTELTLKSNQVEDSLMLSLTTDKQVKLMYEIFSVEGLRMQYGKLGEYALGQHDIQINIPDLAFGGYVLNVLIDNKPNAFRFIKPYQATN
jgi:hypothetical protein